MGSRREDFAQGAPGDPAGVFQHVFDCSRLHINVNLAIGGTPFGYDQGVDRTLQTSVLRINRFRVWADTARLLTTDVSTKPEATTQQLLIGVVGGALFLLIPRVLSTLAGGHDEYIEVDTGE